MLCYYIIFDTKTNFEPNLKKNWSQNIIKNPTKSQFKSNTQNIYQLDTNSDFGIVFLSIKWQDSNSLEKFLNQEKAVYDILGDIELPKTKFKFKKIDLTLILILLITIIGCIYYKDLLWPQILELYQFLKTEIKSKIQA